MLPASGHDGRLVVLGLSLIQPEPVRSDEEQHPLNGSQIHSTTEWCGMPSTRDAAVQAPSATVSTTAASDADAYTPACLLSRRRDATAKAATDSLALAASATEGRYRSGSGVDVTDDRKCVHVSLFDIEHGNVNLSQKGVSALLPRIAIYAQTITYLNLSCNALKSLPDEIGHLYRLKELDVSGNQLESLPTTLAYCQQLRWIDASANQLVDLPTSIRHIHSLATLNLAGNSLEAVPRCLWRLRNLKSLDLSCNLIRVLPARMFMPGGAAAPNTGTLSMLVLDGCPLGSGFTDHIRNPSLVITSRFKHGVISGEDANDRSEPCRRRIHTRDCCATPSPQRRALPSLVDTVVSRMANCDAEYTHELPDHLQERLDSLVQCDGCHALYPAGSGVTRLRLLYRNKTIWPIEYNFCKPHWSNERQRIASLFGPRKPECLQPYFEYKRAALSQTASKLAPVNKLLSREPSSSSLVSQTSIYSGSPSVYRCFTARTAACTAHTPFASAKSLPYSRSTRSTLGSASCSSTADSRFLSIRQGFRKLISAISSSSSQQPPARSFLAGTQGKTALAAKTGTNASGYPDSNAEGADCPTCVASTGMLGQAAARYGSRCHSRAAVSVWNHFEDDIPALPAL